MTDSIKNEFLELRKKIIEKEFSRMNDKQREAVFSTEGPLFILAGAGSGKTTVIVNRVANIVKYGQGYNSDEVPDNLTQNDIELLKNYLENGEDEFGEVRELLAVYPAKPWEILAITFTNKAAGELKDRLSAMLGDEANDIWASTFHSACARIMRREGGRLGYSNHFTIYDTDDSKRVMKECQRLLGIDDKNMPQKMILNEISRAKDNLITPEEYAQQAGDDYRLKKIASAYMQYEKMLKNADAMDFDDLLMKTVELLEKNEDVRKYYQKRFKYVMIDEYQDTNHAQYMFAKILADGYKNICVVGDDDQSIYRFRGATIENIMNFEKHYENTKVVRLEQNYRSTQTILDAANAVISNNSRRKGKNLWTSNGKGEKIKLYTGYNEQAESEYIADTIMDDVSSGRKWSDHAILYRMNAQSNAIERAFVKMGVPYRVIGGFRFYERKEIRDAIAYLSVINNPNDDVRLRRIINEPKRGIGNTTLNHAAEIAAGLGISLYEVIKTADQYEKLSRASAKLMQFGAMLDELIGSADELSLHGLFEAVMDKSGYVKGLELDKETYEDRLENLNELSSNLVNYESENEEATLEGFLEEVSLMTDIDNYDADADTVVMMTLHSAKGLEFPIVFMPGMEEGIFPGMQSMNNPTEVEEERRLAYVGITRAKEKLYMTNAETRMLYGTTARNRPSRFVEEIPEELTDGGRLKVWRMAPEPQETVPKHSYMVSHSFGQGGIPMKQSNEKYSVGDTVIHKTFGTGVVLKAQAMGNDTLLEIAFDKAGTKKLMAKFARLTKA